MTRIYVENGTLVLDEINQFYSHIHTIGGKDDSEESLMLSNLTKGVLVAYGTTENGNPFLLMKRYEICSEQPQIVGLKAVKLKNPINLETATKKDLEKLGIDLYNGFAPV